MKKLVALFLVVILLLFAVGCENTEKTLPVANNLTKPLFCYLEPQWMQETATIPDFKTRPANNFELEECLDIFDELIEGLGIEKPFPEIRVADAGVASSDPLRPRYAIYQDGILYLLTEDIHYASVAHELCQYLAENNGSVGFIHSVGNGEYTGYHLTKGITNYFSSRISPFRKSEVFHRYYYETHIATMISIIYGEEALKKDFFSSNVGNLKEDFNYYLDGYYQAMAKDAGVDNTFDAFCGCVDSYSIMMWYAYDRAYSGDDTAAAIALKKFKMLAVSIEEMLLIYASKKGCFEEAYAEFKAFSEVSYEEILVDFSELGRAIG